MTNEMHTRVGEPGGPALCPTCHIKSYYSQCVKCGHVFDEDWLRPIAEREQRIHVGAGHKTIPMPTVGEILSRKASES